MTLYILVTGACPFDGDFKCNYTGTCYRSNEICNGYYVCSNGEDKAYCGNEYYVLTYIYIFIVYCG